MTRMDKATNCGKMLADALGKKFGNCWKQVDGRNVADIGCWDVDYNSIYGGAVIHEIMNENGGVNEPFGSARRKPDEFCSTINFALRAIDLRKK